MKAVYIKGNYYYDSVTNKKVGEIMKDVTPKTH